MNAPNKEIVATPDMFYQKKGTVLELEGDVDDDDEPAGETLLIGGAQTDEHLDVDEDDGESGDEMLYKKEGNGAPEQVISDLEEENPAQEAPAQA